MQNWSIEHRTSSPHYPHSNGLAESMVKVSKNLIEKAVLQDLPQNQLLLDYRCTPISREIPSPAEILFGRKFQSSISILPSQVMNDKICKQRELAKKEGKFYTNIQETAASSSQGRVKRIPILHTLSQLQDSHRFHKNLQSFSKQFQVAKLPVQWMPFPQYPQHCRIRILHLGTPGHPPGLPKEFLLQGLDY